MKNHNISDSKCLYKSSSSYFSNSQDVKRVFTQLAVKTSVNESLMVAQIDYWIQKCKDQKHLKEGRYWIWKTYDEWHEEMPFWSKTTVRNLLRSLKKRGLVLTGRFNTMNIDQTKWYTIDYELLDELTSTEKTDNPEVSKSCNSGCKEVTVRGVNNLQLEVSKGDTPIPKNTYHETTTTENTTTETTSNMDYPDKRDNHTSEKNQDEDEQPSFKNKPIAKREDIEAGLSMLKSLAKPEDMFCINCIEYYFDKFEDCEGHPHFQIEFFDMDKVKRTMDPYFQYVDEDIMKSAIDVHFETEYPTKPIDYDIRHFATDGILKNRLYECGSGHINV